MPSGCVGFSVALGTLIYKTLASCAPRSEIREKGKVLIKKIFLGLGKPLIVLLLLFLFLGSCSQGEKGEVATLQWHRHGGEPFVAPPQYTVSAAILSEDGDEEQELEQETEWDEGAPTPSSFVRRVMEFPGLASFRSSTSVTVDGVEYPMYTIEEVADALVVSVNIPRGDRQEFSVSFADTEGNQLTYRAVAKATSTLATFRGQFPSSYEIDLGFGGKPDAEMVLGEDYFPAQTETNWVDGEFRPLWRAHFVNPDEFPVEYRLISEGVVGTWMFISDQLQYHNPDDGAPEFLLQGGQDCGVLVQPDEGQHTSVRIEEVGEE